MGARVKSGCITCRIRRIKCDEGKPQCKRCVSTRRVCDGYLENSDVRPRRALVTAVKNLGVIGPVSRALSRVPSTASSASTSDAEHHDSVYFDLFRCVTVKGTSALFPSSFWQGSVLQMAHSEPAIWHATVAIGMLHQSLQVGVAGENRKHEDALVRQAEVHYGHAMKLAKELKSPTKVVTLSLTLIAVANMMERWAEGQAHVLAGLRILANDKGHDASLQSLGAPLMRFDFQAMTFSVSTAPYPFQESGVAFSAAKYLAFTPMTPDLSYEALSSELFGMERSFFLLEQGLLMSEASFGPWLTSFDAFVLRLSRWEAKMAYFEAQQQLHDTDDQFITKIGLRLHHAMLRLLIESSVIKFEVHADNYLGLYEYIIRLSATLTSSLSTRSDPNVFPLSLEPGIIIPLWVVIHACRHRPLRHAALHVLGTARRAEGMWRSDQTAKGLAAVVAAEEECIPADVLNHPYVPVLFTPESSFIPWKAWHDPKYQVPATVSWANVPLIPESMRVRQILATAHYKRGYAHIRLVMSDPEETSQSPIFKDIVVRF